MFSGGFNPKQLKKMEKQMKKMGMNMKELDDVEQVVITLKDKEIVVSNPEVSIMKVMGQETYQVSGVSEERLRTDIIGSVEDAIGEDDIELVVAQTGKTPDEAKEALVQTGGDLAEAIMRLSE